MHRDSGGLDRFLTLLRFTRIHHSLFALPFLYLGVLEYTLNPDLILLVYATIAFIGIRCFAIIYSDIIDLEYDRVNPRARDRPLVKGEVSVREAWILAIIMILIYLTGIYLIDHVIYLLWWIPIVLILVYPYLKKTIPISHFILGSILAIAPWGGYIVYSMKIEYGPIDLALATIFWVAGFDIIYHIQDIDIGRRYGIKNIPVLYGEKGSLITSITLYILAIILLFINWIRYSVGLTYLLGILLTAIIFYYEIHIVVRSLDQKNIVRSFNMNLYIGPILLISYLIDILFYYIL